MRYLLQTLLFISMIVPVGEYSAAHARPYDGLGPGESTIGIGGDYHSLDAACDAVSAQPLTGGDWTFLILNDLEEPNNVSLTQDVTNGHTITIRPAPATTPTVTFTTTTANNSGLRGHFNIGTRVDKLNPDGSYIAIPTQDVVIDGSNDPTTSARSMTWKNTGHHGGSNPLVAVYGDSENITVRNCNIEFQTPNFNELYNRAAVEFCSFTFSMESGYADQVPDFGRVQNCHIELEDAYLYGYGISLNNRTVGAKNFAYPPARGMVAANNDIISGAEAIVVRNCSDASITGNNILINARLRSSRIAIHCIGAATPDDTGILNLDSNTIVCTGTEISHWRAIGVDGRGTTTSFILSNNIISSLCDSNFTLVVGINAIADESSTVTIAHNSMNFHTTATNTQLGRYRAVNAYDGKSPTTAQYVGNTFIRNNIFRMNIENGIIYALAQGSGQLESENNIVYTTSTAHVGWIGQDAPPLTTLEDWQTSTGQDMESVIMDPFVPTATGLGTWAGPPDDPNQDLHFSAYPGDDYLVPPMPAITTDHDGQPRDGAATLAGADEVQRLTAVDVWRLY